MTTKAVAAFEGRPHLELAADEWVFPIEPVDGLKIHVRCKPAFGGKIKPFYSSILRKRKSKGKNETISTSGDMTKCRAFIDVHFLGFANAETEAGEPLTRDEEFAWLDANPEIKDSIFRQGYDAIGGGKADSEEPLTSKRVVLIFARPEAKIDAKWTQVDEGEEREITLSAVLGRLSREEKHQYDKAFEVVENNRQNTQYVDVNWDVIELLFDRKVTRLEGALIRGVPCTAENKSDWLSLVPFALKISAMSRLAAEIEAKNAQ